MTLLGATTPNQNGPESNGNEGVLHIPQNSWTGASPSDGFVLYPGHSLVRGLTPFAEMQLMHSTAPAESS